jgi:hypothetical protein
MSGPNGTRIESIDQFCMSPKIEVHARFLELSRKNKCPRRLSRVTKLVTVSPKSPRSNDLPSATGRKGGGLRGN